MNLKKRTIRSIGWNISGNIVKQIVNFIVSAILSRILSPREFGLFGMVLVFSGFANLFISLGFGPAIIQKSNVDEDHLQTVFSINLISGFSLMLILMILSPLVAMFYSEPILKPLTILISINFMIYSMRSVQIALLIKKLEFKKYILIDISANLISGIIAILLAVAGYGVWSLALRTVFMSCLYILFLWKKSDWKPSYKMNFSKFKEMWKFSSHLIISNILNYWEKNIDNLIVGKMLGSIALGVYSRAYFLMLLPVTQLSEVINTVLFPVFSKVNEDKIKIKKSILHILNLLSFVSFPLMTALFVLAEPFINAVYGPKWVEVIPVLKVLCFSGMLLSITIPFRSVYLSLGRTDILFKWTLYESACIIFSIMIGIKWGILGVAVGITIANYCFIWYPSWRIPGKLIDLKFREVIRKIQSNMISAALMGVLLTFILSKLNHFKADISNMGLTVIGLLIGVAIYLLISYIIKPSIFKEANGLINMILAKQ